MAISRWKLASTGLAVAAAAGFAAVSWAATPGSATYTGCLSTTGGLSKVAVGATPIGATCPSGTSLVTLSGGDITAVTASTGLSGGAALGNATLALAPSYRLPQSCAAGQIARSNGAGGWTCFSGPKAINIDIPATNPETPAIVNLPYGFHLQLQCNSTFGPAGFVLYASSDTNGDANVGGIREDDSGGSATLPVAGGVGLGAGAYAYLFASSSATDTIRYEGQLILHAGAHVTAVAFHAIANVATGRCQLTGVATPAS